MWFHHQKTQTPAPALFRAFLLWLPIAAGITVMSLFVYTAVQQNYRQSLNDPQIQMAEDATAALTSGKEAIAVVPSTIVNMKNSLAVWVTVFDRSNTVVASNAILDGVVPVPPAGVMHTARVAGQNRVSWQPQFNVRSATVSVAIKDGSGRVVTVGRSMREVEQRAQQLSVLVLGAWVVGLLATLITTVAVRLLL